MKRNRSLVLCTFSALAIVAFGGCVSETQLINAADTGAAGEDGDATGPSLGSGGSGDDEVVGHQAGSGGSGSPAHAAGAGGTAAIAGANGVGTGGSAAAGKTNTDASGATGGSGGQGKVHRGTGGMGSAAAGGGPGSSAGGTLAGTSAAGWGSVELAGTAGFDEGAPVAGFGGQIFGWAGASGGFGPTSVGGYGGSPVSGDGSGAFSGYGGWPVGGYGGAAPSCVYPTVDFTPSDWIDPPPQTPQEKFDSAVSGLVGSWHGVVTTPWVPPYEVVAEFDADGHYSARCVFSSDDCCVAFYYGTDKDTPLKTYSIEDATLSGNVTGTIDIVFGVDGSFSAPAWQGELSHVDIDGDGNRARFDFDTSDGYGPVHFELQRDTPSN